MSRWRPGALGLLVVLGCSQSHEAAPVTSALTSSATTAALDQSDCPGGYNVILGTSGDDTLNGTSGQDCIVGLGGNDTINAGDGNDFIIGGDGDDNINAGGGNDTVYGEAGNDTLTLGDGNDTADAGDGNDTITAGNGDDTINGGAGDDTVTGGNGNDTVNGGDGNDTITGDDGNDIINGGAGNDTISGGLANDTLNGDSGNDIIDAGTGSNSVNGGADVDACSGTNCENGNCGNGVIDDGEACDDGNFINGDGCNANCAPAACVSTARPSQTFATGSYIIPMDTTYQDYGMLRAFGLLNRLLRNNITVYWIVRVGKAHGSPDFIASSTDVESGATITNHGYRGGPFVVDSANAAAAQPIINAWLASDTVTVVHRASASFTAEVARTLTAAPRIGVFADANELIAFEFLNAAGVTDSLDNAWPTAAQVPPTYSGWPDVLDPTEMGGPTTTSHSDGALFLGNLPAYCQLTSMHYDASDAESVAEIRSWLDLGPLTHAFMECIAAEYFEDHATYGFFLSTGGLEDTNKADPTANQCPDEPFSQYDGDWEVHPGTMDGLKLKTGSSLRANSRGLITERGNTSTMAWITGYLDGSTNNGKVTYLAGHQYTTIVPITANPRTNGVRLFLNSLFESPCVTPSGQANLTLTKSAPSYTNGTQITFDLSYSNAGPGAALSAVLSDTVPAGTTFVSATGGGTLSGGAVTWNLGTLPSGASGTVSFTVSVSVDGTYNNSATLTYQENLTVKTITSNTTSTVRDTVLPDTFVDSGPANPTDATSATFTFSADEPELRFECSVDSGAFFTCTSGYTVGSLALGTHTFDVRAVDLAGNTDSSPARHTWRVNATPVAANDSATTNEDTAVTTTVLANDTGLGDTPLTVTVITAPTNGSAVVNAGNTITYTPAANYFGSDSYVYRIVDNDGQSTTATVSITVNSVNDVPDAINDTATTNEDTAVTTSVLANDTGLGDGSITVTIVTAPTRGSVVVNAGNTITYTPTADLNGADSYVYRVTDVNGDSDTATVSVTVNAVDDLPVANNDAATTNEDTAVTTSVLGNDTGLGDGGLVVTIVTAPTRGSVVVNAGNTITYTPTANLNGADSYVYRVTDADGDSATATVSVTVNAVNDTPNAIDDSASTNEDTAVTVNVLANDVGAVDGTITVTIVTVPSNGSAVVNAGNTITYTPNANFFGADSLVYRVTDGDGENDTATVSITVNSVDDQPVAVNDAATTNEDTAVTTTVLSNDTGLGDGSLTVTIVTSPTRGSVVVNAGNTITYTPSADLNGADSYVYRVTDGDGDSATATVSVTVNAVNDVPVAVNDTVTTNEDTAVATTVLANDTGIGDTPLTVTVVTAPTNGSTSVAGNVVTYTPAADYNGADSYVYRVTDGNGESATATVGVTINAVDDQPVAANDSGSTNEDTAVTVTVLTNDTGLGDRPLTITVVGAPSNGSAVVNAGNTITYTPSANFFGSDSLRYRVTDADGDFAEADVALTVNAVNDTPVAAADTATTNEDTAVTTSVLTNDTGLGDTPVTVSVTTAPTRGSTVVNADNTVTYTPNADVNGADSYSYRVTDVDGQNSTATVTVTINAVNDVPSAVNDSATTNEDTAVTVTVLANDTGIGDTPLTVTVQSGPSRGSAVVNAGNTITYTPNANINGADSFTYQVRDADGQTSTATVNVTINAVNDTPAAVNDTATTNEDTAVTTSVLANDTGLGDTPLTVTVVTAPTRGNTVVNADNTVTYTPNANINGADSYVYEVRDADGQTSTATVNVTINAVNDTPSAVADADAVNEDSSVTTAVLTNDSGLGDTPLTVSIATTPSNGSAVANADNTVTYTPSANFNGTDSYVYRVRDTDGQTSTATVTITVNAVNDTPAAVNDSASVNEDSPVTTTVLVNDTGLGDTPVTVTIVTNGANGTAVVNAGNTVTYTPVANFNGTDSYTYRVTDADGQTSDATVSVTVNGVNDTPVAVADAATTNEDTAVTTTVLANDTGLGDTPLSVTIVTNGTNGTAVVNAGNTVTYTPSVNFNGTDSYTYRVTDVDGQSATATVTVTINAVNDTPSAVNDSATTNEDTAVTTSVLTNDTGLGDTPVTVTIVTNGASGTAVVNAGNTVTYTPSANFFGSDSYIYRVTDADGQTSDATVSVTVNAVDDQPVAVNDAAGTNEDTAVTTTVLANDTALGDTPLSVTIVTNGTNGTAVVNAGNTVTYTPAANFNGTDSYTYRVTDVDGDSATATVNVTINAVNDTPAAVNDTASVNEDSSVTTTVLANDTGLGDAPVAVSVTGAPANGATVVNADNTVTYTPNADFNGADSYTYRVTDNDGQSSTATVNITVNGTDDTPNATNDNGTCNENGFAILNVLSNDTGLGDTPVTLSVVVDALNGAATVNPDNTIRYTPNASYNGPDTFTYQVADADGDSDLAVVFVTVDSVDDVPVAVNDAASVAEDAFVTTDVLSNDSGLGDTPISVSIRTPPANGTAVVNADQTVRYTPNANFNGADSYVYRITDSDGDTADATVAVNVSAVNDTPVANNDSATVAEDGSVTTSVLLNDTGLGDAPVVVTVASVPANGSAVVNADNTVTYTPAANFFGSDSFTYRVTDVDDQQATATVSITVTPANDVPVALDDTDTTDEDTAVTTTVLTNDTGLGDAPVTVTITVAPTRGTAVVNADNTVTYTPDPQTSGNDSYDYEVSDVDGETSTATVSITVNAINDTPVAAADTGNTSEDVALIVDVLVNDTGTGDTPLQVVATSPANGTAVVLADNRIRYTPRADFNGVDTFQYTVTDQDNQASSADVTVTVAAVNDTPVATADSATTDEDVSVTVQVLVNDVGLGDAPVVVSVGTPPANGAVVVNVDNSITYTPGADNVGLDSFVYVVTDDDGETASASVDLTINPINDTPVATNDVDAVPEEGTVTTAVLANDSGLGDQPVLVSITTPPAVGSAVVNGDNTVTFTAPANFNGQVTYTYEVRDSDGELASAQVTVDVGAVDDVPVAVADNATLDEDTSVTVDVTLNDLGLGDLPITVSIAVPPVGGSAVVNADGTITYTPAPDFNGSDALDYRVRDADGQESTATVSFTVNATNDTPAALDDTASGPEDADVTVAVLANDLGVGDRPLTITVVTPPSQGSTTVNPDGTISFTPAPQVSGDFTFEYEVVDADLETTRALVTVTIDPVNDTPTAVADNATAPEDGSVTVDVLANDTGVGDMPVTVTLERAPGFGVAVVNADNTVTYTPAANFFGTDTLDYRVADVDDQFSVATLTVVVTGVDDAPVAVDDAASTDEDVAVTVAVLSNDSGLGDTPVTVSVGTAPTSGTALVNADNTITYTPFADAVGNDSFTYVVGDADGQNATATVTITLRPIDDVPVANDDAASCAEGTVAVVAVLANDSGIGDAPLTVTVTSTPGSGTAVVNPDGTVTYTPQADFFGTDGFVYQVVDADGQGASATVVITVGGANDTPSAVDDSATSDEDTAVNINVLANDLGAVDLPISVSINGAPTSGSASVESDGSITYAPTANSNGTDTFTYVVTDADGESSQATVTVTINAINDAPSCQPDAINTEVAQPALVDVLANDTDVENDALLLVSVTGPTHGTAVITADNKILYTPEAGYSGNDTFTYSAGDGNGGLSSALVVVTIGLDTDSDGLTDVQEQQWNTDPNNADTDGDQIEDGREVFITLTTPNDDDSDDDGLEDGTEDADQDGVVDSDETSATALDTDGDGLQDGTELGLTAPEGQDTLSTVFIPDADPTTRTLPGDDDSDDDGVMDGNEDLDHDGGVDTGEANPLARDSDGDGLPDGLELGLTAPQGDDTNLPDFVADADPSTTTNPALVDTDTGGLADGVEDVNLNGRIDPGEKDPNDPTDDGTTLDFDGDGLLDAEEYTIGTDPSDADSDDDGVVDGSEPSYRLDSDGDGLINAMDADADNDGLFDGTELGLTAPATGTDTWVRNFIPDADPATTTSPLLADTDGGTRRDGAEDVNHNGRVDAGETDPNNPADDTTVTPTDGDGDGLDDAEEATLGTDPADADSDDDGVRDGFEPNFAVDSDGDGLINPLDPDSDNDGVLDGTELGLTAPDASTNVQRGHFLADVDPATVTNALLADTDRGGARDGAEDGNHNGQVDSGETNPLDPSDDNAVQDTDGDGLSNVEERAIGTNEGDADSDDDGVVDGMEANYALDTDADGQINALDLDSDNDLVFDGTEVSVVTPHADTQVDRGNFVADADPAAHTSMVVVDSDRGTVGDGVEDTNHNGAIDVGETNPNDPTDDIRPPADTDSDGLPDAEELTLGTNYRDADSDDDGVIDGAEPRYAEDTDNDRLINALDQDSDNDGVVDGTELGVVTPHVDTNLARGFFLADADPSTTTDPLDADTDDGTIDDGAEDGNHNGRIDEGETNPNNPADDLPGPPDIDNDGLSNTEEALVGTNPEDADSDDDGVIDGLEPNYAIDTDGDEAINALDHDSDNDGIFDGTELGVTTPGAATNVDAGRFVADVDPGTTTNPLAADTDSGTVDDGVEDANHNGRIDPGETDPNDPADDQGGSSSSSSGGSSSTGGTSSSSGSSSGQSGGTSSSGGSSSGESSSSGSSSGESSSGGGSSSGGSSTTGSSSGEISSTSSSSSSSGDVVSGGSSSGAGGVDGGSINEIPNSEMPEDGFVAGGGCLNCASSGGADAGLLALVMLSLRVARVRRRRE
ncbi:MAG: tandem-95 repeat protein [Myxococcota bacterium]